MYLVFTGRPNAGKSSLIREISGLTVTTGKHPGTTRKIMEYPLQKGLCLIDTPGLGKMTRASKRLEGIMNARVINYLLDKSHEVALAIHVLDISTFLEVTRRLEKKGFISIDVEMVHLLAKILDEHPLIAANKIDKADEEEINTNLEEFIRRIERKYSIKESDFIYPVSVKTGEGMSALKRAVHSRLVRKGFRTPFKLH